MLARLSVDLDDALHFTDDSLTLTPLTPTIGAEVGGIDLSQPATPSQVSAIRQALLDHGVVFFRGQGAGNHAQAARHAQVQKHDAGITAEQQVLGAAADALDGLALQRLRHPLGKREAEILALQVHLLDAGALDVGGKAAADGFDFGQFGH